MASESLTGRLVVIGASAGGIAALMELAHALPMRFGAPVCVVQHVGANRSHLPELLSSHGPLPAVHARDLQRLEPGCIYVAPPDHHLLVEGRFLRLTQSEREHHTRPAIDPLFRSAALGWGARVIGVVLSGCMDDGSEGLAAIKRCGGTAIVQDPATAQEPSMPQCAIEATAVDFVGSVAAIAELLSELVRGDEPRPRSSYDPGHGP